jgi:uncharacterized protein YkwD
VPIYARRLLLSCGAIAGLALPSPAMAACSGADASPAEATAAAATLCLLNEQRAAQRLPVLNASAQLDQAARGFAGEMVRRRFFDHVAPDGTTMLQRIKASGWVGSGAWTVGENIAWGSGSYGTPASIVDGWMNSAGHRANILNGSFTEIGIGIAAGAPQSGVRGTAGTYVTDFGSASGAATSAAAKPKKPLARCATRAAVRAHVAKGATKRCTRR